MELFVVGYILQGIIVLFAILKTIHFIKNKNHNWKPYHWIYFSNNNIKGSTGPQRAELKRTQNRLSIIIFILLFVLIIFQLFITQWS